MAYLLKTQEVYRVENEKEAKQLIEDAKQDGAGDLVKYACDYHERKSKGEVIDSWYRVTLCRNFCDEKEPDGFASVKYEV
jgi:transcription elongation factor GreA-like protein